MVAGIILSIIGNVLVVCGGILGAVFGILCGFDKVSIALPIVFAALTIAGYIIAIIGNKIDDKKLQSGPLMKTKRILLGILKAVTCNLFVGVLAMLAVFGMIPDFRR